MTMRAAACCWRATRRSWLWDVWYRVQPLALPRVRKTALTQVPRFLAVAPGANLGSGNEVIVAAHLYSVRASPSRRVVSSPPVHQSSSGVPVTRSGDYVRA